MQRLGDESIYPVPKIELFLADLVEVAQAPDLAEVGLEGMRDDLVLREEAPLIIKPALDGCSTGIMRLQHPGDLVAYATAIAQQWDEIPEELTPGAPPAHAPTPGPSCMLFAVVGMRAGFALDVPSLHG